MTTTRPPLLTQTDLPRGGSIGFEAFIAHIRKRMRDLPLTMTLHGWGSETATEFFEILDGVRRAGDAIWIVTLAEPADRIATERQDIAVLSADYETNRFIFDNLVIDLAIFCSATAEELAQATHLGGRCSVMVVYDRGPYTDDLLNLGREQGIVVCTWRGAKIRTQPKKSAAH